MKTILQILLSLFRNQQQQAVIASLDAQVLHKRIDMLEKLLRLTLANFEPDVFKDPDTISDMKSLLRKSRVPESARNMLDHRTSGNAEINDCIERLAELLGEEG
jgi:hypothetical protein